MDIFSLDNAPRIDRQTCLPTIAPFTDYYDFIRYTDSFIGVTL